MRAIFIAVGSEMLEMNRIDTNSLYVARKLLEKGIILNMKVVVGDDMENLAWLVKQSIKRSQLVIITGGLGPTEDDMTREAVANAMKRELVYKEEILETVRERFKRRRLDMPDINARQAFIIEGADVLPNPLGTAPGLYIDDEQAQVLLLPGPPPEMKPMFDQVLEERIAPLCNYQVYKRTLKFGGVSESGLDAEISDIYAKFKNPKTTVLANPFYIEVHLMGRSRKDMDETKALTDEIAEKIKERKKDQLVTEEDISFEEFIVAELKKHKLTLCTAESCTGGGLGNTITNVPGSSDVFTGGIIAYSNHLKMNLLGVDEYTLEKHGAVSKDTAEEMAKGVRKLTGADIGVSITGIAGPGGGSPGKPVGLVFVHISAEDAEIGSHQLFSGSRDMIKKRTINYALDQIRKYLKTRKT